MVTSKGGYARFDFAIFDENNTLQYLIEYDGTTHDYSHIGGWNSIEKVQYQQECDRLKNEYCLKYGIPLLRISYKQMPITYADLILNK